MIWNIQRLCYIWSLMAIIITIIVLYDIYSIKKIKNKCNMTYSWPIFDIIEDGPIHPKYQLMTLHMKKKVVPSRDGIPLLFIPGHLGSYKQARSIGRHTYDLNKNIDNYVIDFREEYSALSGTFIHEQGVYINQVIKYIQSIYNQTTNLTIIAHSMGGISVRYATTLNDFCLFCVKILITLSTPHNSPPFYFDYKLNNIYDNTNTYWKEYFIQLETKRKINKSVSMELPITISIAGGKNDLMVPYQLTSLDSIIPKNYSLSLLTNSINQVGFSLDHLCILWCEQFLSILINGLNKLIHQMKKYKNMNTNDILSLDNKENLLHTMNNILHKTDNSSNTSIKENRSITENKLNNKISSYFISMRQILTNIFRLNVPCVFLLLSGYIIFLHGILLWYWIQKYQYYNPIYRNFTEISSLSYWILIYLYLKKQLSRSKCIKVPNTIFLVICSCATFNYLNFFKNVTIFSSLQIVFWLIYSIGCLILFNNLFNFIQFIYCYCTSTSSEIIGNNKVTNNSVKLNNRINKIKYMAIFLFAIYVVCHFQIKKLNNEWSFIVQPVSILKEISILYLFFLLMKIVFIIQIILKCLRNNAIILTSQLRSEDIQKHLDLLTIGLHIFTVPCLLGPLLYSIDNILYRKPLDDNIYYLLYSLTLVILDNFYLLFVGMKRFPATSRNFFLNSLGEKECYKYLTILARSGMLIPPDKCHICRFEDGGKDACYEEIYDTKCKQKVFRVISCSSCVLSNKNHSTVCGFCTRTCNICGAGNLTTVVLEKLKLSTDSLIYDIDQEKCICYCLLILGIYCILLSTGIIRTYSGITLITPCFSIIMIIYLFGVIRKRNKENKMVNISRVMFDDNWNSESKDNYESSNQSFIPFMYEIPVIHQRKEKIK